MRKTITSPPYTAMEDITEILHGVTITDSYRWLEDQESQRTREWLRAQREYARAYLDAIEGRDEIQRRVRQHLDVDTCDSIRKIGPRFFYRRRLPKQEQFSIYFRESAEATDQLLIDPAERGTGPYTAVNPLHVSPDGRLLLYEIKEGGERTGKFEILQIETRAILPDALPRGYLRGFAFTSDSRSFYYVHEPHNAEGLHNRAVRRHVLGTSFDGDTEVFCVGRDDKVRLHILPGAEALGVLVIHFGKRPLTDFFRLAMEGDQKAEPILTDATYKFGPLLLRDGRILAITDCEAPNSRIIEVRPRWGHEPEFVDVVPETDAVIEGWTLAGDQIFVSYVRNLKREIDVFSPSGGKIGRLPVGPSDTIRLLGGFTDADELLFERESFTTPAQVCRFSPATSEVKLWAHPLVLFDSQKFTDLQVWFTGKDGTRVPMFLVGRRDVLDQGTHPTIMTSYGGYGISMTPRFSVFVFILMELGCLFALPHIRGGSEFGSNWHEAAKRHRRQVAFDDFISAAEWLIQSGRTAPSKLAIFGGSNSGLLVAAAMTQRAHLFRAVLCMVPMLDMLRYHLFDGAYVWKEEFGTADDPEDFAALFNYSPYHKVCNGTAYPATMIVSGDSDQNCNPLHARKMTARLQAANISEWPVFLDYSRHRGHSPVLPLTERLEAMTDRIAFLCDQLNLTL
jgi:prolyl oligopeptidase